MQSEQDVYKIIGIIELSDRNTLHPVLILTNFQFSTFIILQRDKLEYYTLHGAILIPSVKNNVTFL